MGKTCVERRVVGQDGGCEKSDLELLAAQSDVVQKRALEIYFDGAGSVLGPTMGEAIEIARESQPDAEIEKVERIFAGNWKRLSLREKRTFVALHRGEILRLMDKIKAA